MGIERGNEEGGCVDLRSIVMCCVVQEALPVPYSGFFKSSFLQEDDVLKDKRQDTRQGRTQDQLHIKRWGGGVRGRGTKG